MGPKPPPHFDFTRPEQWPEWKERYSRYHRISKTDKESEEFQIDSVLYTMGETAEKIIKLLPAAKTKKYKDLMEEFDKYFQPRSNVAHAIVKFNSRDQLPHESNEAYIRELNDLISKCKFDTQSDDNLKYRLLTGMKDKELSLDLQQLPDTELTLEKVITRMRAKENIQTSQRDSVEVNAVFGKHHATARPKVTTKPGVPQHKQRAKQFTNSTGSSTGNNASANNFNCSRCGRQHARRQCPAYGQNCRKCGKPNHFSKQCKSAPRTDGFSKTVHENHYAQPNDSADINIGSVAKVDACSKSVWLVDIFVNNVQLQAKVDTGAQVNILSNADFSKLGSSHKISPAETSLSAYNGSVIRTLGVVTLMFSYNNRTYNADFYVNDSPGGCTLIGLETLREVGLVDSVGSGSTGRTVLEQYKDVFEGLGKVTNYQHSITVDPTASPVACASRTVPIHIQPKLRAELERLESLGIIQKQDQPTDWVSPIAIAPKPNGDIRVCLDPVYLNKAIQREHYTIPTTQEILSRIGTSKFFSVVDATSGFHQVELTPESSRLTTFITPLGRYSYTRLPFGLTSSAEVYHKVMVGHFGDLEGVEIYIDDMLVHAESKQEHDVRLRRLLDRCREVNLKLNKEKAQIGQSKVTFLGHVVSDGLEPKRDRTDAILNMNRPHDKSDVMRFLGMVNYVGKFCKDLAVKSEPLRKLIRKDVDFVWDSSCDRAFSEIKGMIASAPVLKRFNKDDEITIQVDASSHTLGAVIMQNEQPVEYATKPLNKTQTRYAQIEKALLAVLFGCRKFHYYVYGGKTFTVETDHKPLVTMIQKEIDEIRSPRLRRMIMHLRDYAFNLKYKQGKDLVIADTLSRANYEVEVDIVDVVSFDPMSACKDKLFPNPDEIRKFQVATQNDQELQILASHVTDGWPGHRKACGYVGRKYWQNRERIGIHDQLLFYDDRLIIPLEYQRAILEKLHEGHLGINKTTNLAKTSVYWVGMCTHIEEMIASCSQCRQYTSMNKRQPLLQTEVPEFPFQIVGTDIFHHNGINYLVIADYYSKWYQVRQLKGMSSREVIMQCDELFSSFGTPQVVRSDNARQYDSADFKEYCRKNNINHVTSSPTYAQSNGLAKAFVKIAKTLVKKCDGDMEKVNLGLRRYRNTPVNEKLPAPSVLLQGQYLYDELPRTGSDRPKASCFQTEAKL